MKIQVRRAFISDVHLGSAACKADKLLQFLETYSFEELYLVGDIIDGWRLQRRWYFPSTHTDVCRRLLKLANKCKVVYIPGNHDEFLRPLLQEVTHIGNIQIRNKYVLSINNKKFLVVHGDAFDVVTRHHRKLALLGDKAYVALIVLNRWLNLARERLGMPYWSLAGYMKTRVKQALEFIFAFEDAATRYAAKLEYDGIICGHIHQPAIKEKNGVTYINCGDWCENCSAIIETYDNEIKVVKF